MNQTVTYGPFFKVVDLLARSPLGGAAPASDDEISTAVKALTPEQQDAVLSGDWGRIQQAIKAEQAQRAQPGAKTQPPDPDGPWNLFQLEVRAAAIKVSLSAQ
jgi:hypothetical protein